MKALAQSTNRRGRGMASKIALELLMDSLCCGMTLSNSAGDQFVIFLEDASSPGKFRYQCFDAKGFYSHSTHNTLEEALRDAFNSSFRILCDDNVLDRLSCTVEWSRGVARQGIRDKYNSGQIGWDEMLEMMREVDSVAG